MIGWIAQASEFEVWQNAVRQQFEKGGSIVVALLVLLAIAGGIIVVGWLTRVQSKLQKGGEVAVESSDPKRLYTHLLCNLGLTVPQRQLLESIARDLKLEHPASLLVSERLYDQCVERWMSDGGGRSDSERASAVKAKSRLFPEGTGMVFTSAESIRGSGW